MKSLIVFDSLFGNTEKIARAIGQALGSEAKVARVSEVSLLELKSIDLLIVGSPTQGGRPTPAILEFLGEISATGLKGIGVSAFDTRFALKEHGVGLQILMSVIHFAAEKITKILINKGGKLVAKPEGFIVEDKEGPLKKGEHERASAWAKGIIKLFGGGLI